MNTVNSPEANVAGFAVACLTALNSFFQMFNPVLTGIFYVASIAWLCVQIYHKVKYKNKNEK